MFKSLKSINGNNIVNFSFNFENKLNLSLSPSREERIRVQITHEK